MYRLLLFLCFFCPPIVAEIDPSLAEIKINNASDEAYSPYDTSQQGQPFFIRDYLFVPLRSGPSSAYRVIHKGLKSGAIVKLIKSDTEKNFSLVKAQDNTEGWLPSYYLMEEQPALLKLKEAQKTIANLSQGGDSLALKYDALERENQLLSAEINKLSGNLAITEKELTKIKTISSMSIEIAEENNLYQQQLQTLKTEVDTLKAENTLLKNDLTNNDFLNGALVLALAFLLYLLAAYFFKNRRRSEWR